MLTFPRWWELRTEYCGSRMPQLAAEFPYLHFHLGNTGSSISTIEIGQEWPLKALRPPMTTPILERLADSLSSVSHLHLHKVTNSAWKTVHLVPVCSQIKNLVSYPSTKYNFLMYHKVFFHLPPPIKTQTFPLSHPVLYFVCTIHYPKSIAFQLLTVWYEKKL